MDEMNPEVTRILNAAGAGDRQAAEELIPMVYGELRKLAAGARSAPAHRPNKHQRKHIVRFKRDQ